MTSRTSFDMKLMLTSYDKHQNYSAIEEQMKTSIMPVNMKIGSRRMHNSKNAHKRYNPEIWSGL